MSLWSKAVIAGIVIEGILWAVFVSMDWEPSGPVSPGGRVVLWLHYPAIFVTDAFAKFKPPEWLAILLGLVVSAAQWTLIVYALQRWKLRR